MSEQKYTYFCIFYCIIRVYLKNWGTRRPTSCEFFYFNKKIYYQSFCFICDIYEPRARRSCVQSNDLRKRSINKIYFVCGSFISSNRLNKRLESYLLSTYIDITSLQFPSVYFEKQNIGVLISFLSFLYDYFWESRELPIISSWLKASQNQFPDKKINFDANFDPTYGLT